MIDKKQGPKRDESNQTWFAKKSVNAYRDVLVAERMFYAKRRLKARPHQRGTALGAFPWA